MVYNGHVPPSFVTKIMADTGFDVKKIFRANQKEITGIIRDLGDATKTELIIDGISIKKSDTFRLQIAISNKLESLSNQSSTLISVFNELYKIEKSLTS